MYIAAVLEKEGIKAEILDLTPGRSAVVARLRSTATPDPSKALLLVAHMDVVGVEKSKWTVDPFAAVEKDGYLYGRGAIDDKGMLAANLAAFIALKRANPRLNRDVIFLATADEEQFGDASVKILIAKYWDKFAAGFALNEGGEVLLKNGKVQYVAVQASEKVPVNVTVIARGTSGHASMPTKDNAVVHLAAAVAKIGNYSAPVRFTTIVRRYFEQLAAIEDDEMAKWMRSLDTPDRGEHAQRVISDANPLWNSMLRDSIAPTMLTAGVRANVIPGEARAAGGADETGERSADPFRDPAGCGTGGAAVFAGKRIVCHNYKGRGERVFQCAGAAVSVHGGHGFRAIEAARRPGLRFSAVPTERRGFAADAWRR